MDPAGFQASIRIFTSPYDEVTGTYVFVSMLAYVTEILG